MSWGRGLCGLEALGLRTNFHEGLDTVIAQRQGMRWENKRLQMAALGRAGKESGQCQQRGWRGTFMGSGGPRGLSSLPSCCPLKFSHSCIPLSSEFRNPVADGGPKEPLGQGERDSGHPEWRGMVKPQGLV